MSVKLIWIIALLGCCSLTHAQSYYIEHSNDSMTYERVCKLFVNGENFLSVGSIQAAPEVFIGKPQLHTFDLETGVLLYDSVYFIDNASSFQFEDVKLKDNRMYCVGIVRDQGGTDNYDNLLLILEEGAVDTLIRYGDSSVFDRLYGVTIDSQGNIICGGVKRKGTGSANGLIAKFTNEGHLIWQQIVDGDSPTSKRYQTKSVATDALDDVYILAEYDTQIAVTKLAGDSGDSIWFKAYPIDGMSIPEEMQTAPDGNLLISGYANLDEFPGFRTHIFMKVDTSGEVLWMHEYLQEVGQSAYQSKFTQLRDGGFAKVYSAFGYPTLLIADENGQVERVHNYSQLNALFPSAVVQVEDGSFVMVGYIIYNQNPEGKTMWILKTDENGELLVSTLPDISTEHVNVYPNPTADFLNVDYDSRNSNNVIYNIVNAQGTIVLSTRSAQIDVHMLPVGNYYLNILDDGTLMVSYKFVKF